MSHGVEKVGCQADFFELHLQLLIVKCEPVFLDYWRQIYNSVVPAFHLNKDHWNSIILDGTVPEEEIYEMIRQSYMLTKKSKSKVNFNK